MFQWSGEDTWCREKMDQIQEELADVLIYSLMMADACQLDVDAIIREKLKRNAEKYPADTVRGSKEKYWEQK